MKNQLYDKFKKFSNFLPKTFSARQSISKQISNFLPQNVELDQCPSKKSLNLSVIK